MSVISKSACLDLTGPMNAEKANKINQRASSMYDLIYCNQYTLIIHSKLSPFQNSVACELVCHNVCLLVACLTSQQQASVSQGQICTDNFTCCHTEIEAANQTFHLTQSQYTDTGPTSPSADPIRQAPGRVATGVPIFKSLVWLDPEKIPALAGFEPGTSHSPGGRLNH